MKSILLFTLLSTSVFAYEDGTYECKTSIFKYTVTITTETLSSGRQVPYMEWVNERGRIEQGFGVVRKFANGIEYISFVNTDSKVISINFDKNGRVQGICTKIK